jgi:hypothetical protein
VRISVFTQINESHPKKLHSRYSYAKAMLKKHKENNSMNKLIFTTRTAEKKQQKSRNFEAQLK